jgi:tetratricopeptide (TPR) repeat protein
MRRALAACLAGSLVAAVAFAAAPPVSGAQDAVAAGREALGKGDYAKAKEIFLAAVAKEPASAEARRGAAEACLGLGESALAIEHATAGLDAVNDEDAGLWALLARGYLQVGDRLPATQPDKIGEAYADAKAKAAVALTKDPKSTVARAVLARACRMTDELDRAEKVVAEGLEAAPKDFDLLFEKGSICQWKKDWEGAAVAFTQATEADPKSADAWYQKGFSLLYIRQFDDACRAFVRSAVYEPPTSTRSVLQIAKYKKEGAIPYYRDILKEAPDRPWAHGYIAYYLAVGKDEAGAKKAMKAAIAVAPDDVAVAAWEGQILETLGQRDAAVKAYMAAIKRNPMTRLAYDRLLEISTNPTNSTSKDDRLAIIDFLGKHRPDEPVFWNNVGLYHRDITKDFKKSLEAYLRAAPLAPGDQGIQNDTGLMYLYHGRSIGEDPRKGLPYFERAVAIVDDDGADPDMGYRDALENLAAYFGPPPLGVEANPDRALEYARRRNDPDLLGRLPKGLGTPSQRASSVEHWAEQQLKK